MRNQAQLFDASYVYPFADVPKNKKEISLNVSVHRIAVEERRILEHQKRSLAFNETIGLQTSKHHGQYASQNSSNNGGSRNYMVGVIDLLRKVMALLGLASLYAIGMWCFIWPKGWYWRACGIAFFGCFAWFLGFLFSHPYSPFRYFPAESASVFCGFLASQQRAIAAPNMSVFSRLLYRNSNSATYSGMYLALTLWKVPTTPRFTSDQKPSIVLVWTAPTTYSLFCGGRSRAEIPCRACHKPANHQWRAS